LDSGASARLGKRKPYWIWLRCGTAPVRGARGYLIKDDDSDQLATAIRTVHAGGVAITPELAFVINLDPR
jgi:hypothetical protein